MVKISHFKIAMGFFGKIWENISISLPRTIPAAVLYKRFNRHERPMLSQNRSISASRFVDIRATVRILPKTSASVAKKVIF